MRNRFLFVITSVLGLLPGMAGAIEFFAEDFESYTLNEDVTTAGVPTYGGTWTISNTAATVETEAQFTLIDTKNLGFGFGLPPEVNFGPATTGGMTTPLYDLTGSAPGGLFMVSAADGIPPNLFPSFMAGTTPDDPELDGGDPWDSRIENSTYSGAANDMISPSFTTFGATGDIWLHASVSSQLNDNGQAIFDIDVSTDGGTTWSNKFRRISPGSGRNFASADFDQDFDVDGADFLTQQRLANYADCTTCNGDDPQNAHDLDSYRRTSDRRFSDWNKGFQESYTPVVATIGATLGDGNAGGNHGELSINLGAALGGEADVKVRFRQFEQRDDQLIAIDNILVNEAPPAGSESNVIYSEDFNSMTLGTMSVYSMPSHPFSFFIPGDSGGGSGTLSGFSWGAQDRDSVEFPTGRYNVGSVGSRGVNHLGHPTAEGPQGQVPFAIIDPKAEEDNTGDPDNFQAEVLHTPILDLSGNTTVILEWDDEAIIDGNPFFGSIASVVLMEDTDGTDGPSFGDTIIAEPDKLSTDFFNPYVPYDQYGGGFFSSDDSSFEHNRIDVSDLVAMAGDKTKLYFAWQYFSQDTQYWAIDNILITGDGIAPLLSAAVTVPEPSALLLSLLGIPALATVRRRLRIRK